MKSRLLSLRQVLCCMVLAGFFFKADFLSADLLQDYAKAKAGYDIYDSFKKDNPLIPEPRMSNEEMLYFSERTVGEGYNYFYLTQKEPPRLLPPGEMTFQYSVNGKDFWMVAQDDIPKEPTTYMFDAKEVCKRSRVRFGYRSYKDADLKRANDDLLKNPEDLSALSKKALVLSDRAKYEGEGLIDYFDTLKKLLRTKLKNGKPLNPNGDLGYFLDVAICLDREADYLNILELMPPNQAEDKSFSKNQYERYKKRLLSNPEEKKMQCRVYDTFT